MSQLRPYYFNGMELDAGDFSAEQTYFDTARASYNRNLHSWGIATGFDVAIDPGNRSVTVEAGFAIDTSGREIVLVQATTIACPALSNRPVNLFVRCEAVPAAPSLETGALGYKRIEQRPVFSFLADDAGADPGDVFLARAILDANGQVVAPLEQASRRYCGFDLGTLAMLDPLTGEEAARLTADAAGGLDIAADELLFKGSVAIARNLSFDRQPSRAMLDIVGPEEELLTIKSSMGEALLTVGQLGTVVIGAVDSAARLTVDRSIGLDGNRAIRFDGAGAVHGGAEGCGLTLGAGGAALVLYAKDRIELSAGSSATMTVLPDGKLSIGGTLDPARPAPALTVFGPVQSLRGGFAFGSGAVQPTAATLVGTVPVGTVVDWWPGMVDGVPRDLPHGFALCDGKPITDIESDFFGHDTPDLIDRYVRGTIDHGRIGKVGGDQNHYHEFYADQPHVHTMDHAHFAPSDAATSPEQDTPISSKASAGSGVPFGHVHAVDLPLGEYNGETTKIPGDGIRGVTLPKPNQPRSARLIKIVRIK